VYAEAMVTGDWPALPVQPVPDDFALAVDREKVLVSGFLRARTNQLSSIPKDAASRGRAFPTPRTWDYAARLSAFAVSVGAPKAVRRRLVAGCVGDAAAHEFLAWVQANDLPDPEALLSGADPFVFIGLRPDRVYVVLQGVLAAVARDRTPERWSAAIRLCADAAGNAGVDPAVPIVRALMRDGMRPPGAEIPAEIKVFAPALALAGLLPGAAA